MSPLKWLQHIGGALRSGVVDFRGQDQIYTLLLSLAALGGVGGFVGGFILHNFAFTVYSILISSAVACIFCIPSWPVYSRDAVEWTPHDPARLEALYLQQQQQQQQQQLMSGDTAAGRGGGPGTTTTNTTTTASSMTSRAAADEKNRGKKKGGRGKGRK